MADLLEGIRTDRGIGEQEQQRQKHEISAELANDRSHLDLFQALLPCPRHFALLEMRYTRRC